MKPEQDGFIEDLFRACFQKMLKHAQRHVRDPEIARDIVQDTFHVAVEKIDVLMDHEKPEAWLMTALKNKIKQYFKQKNEDERFLASLEEQEYPEPGALDQRIEAIHGGDEPDLKKIEEVLTPEEFAFMKRLCVDKAGHLQMAKEYGISVYGSKKKRERIMVKLYEAYPNFKKKKKKNGDDSKEKD